jgi:amino acid adenylation domain-containing protein/non-ribosomal peptide synthase protein (TIGR01720 family)
MRFIMEINKRSYYNLTHPQKRIWYIDKVNLNSPVHNIGGCLNIKGNIDVEKMKETINLIVKGNEGLRLRITEKDGQLVQYVAEFKKEDIDFVDFSNYKEPEKEHERWAEGLFKRSFELEDSRLYYFAVYKIDEEEYGVLLKIHHIIADGWSTALIEKQICEIYTKLVRNEEVCFDGYHSYIDFIEEEREYLNSEKFIKNKNFWREKLKNPPEEFLYNTSNELEGRRLSFNIDNDLSKKIKEFLKYNRCSLNTLFIGLLLIYLRKTTYKNDLVIGTPVFNRIGRKQKSMVGMFTSTMPFRFLLDEELKGKDLIKSINRELKLCFFNQRYPYDILVKDLNLSRKGYDSLFKICVNYYNSQYINDINGMAGEVREYYSGNQGNSLQLTVKEWKDDNIILNFDYKIREYKEEEIQGMYKSMINILRQLLTDGDIKVRDIKLVDEREFNYKIYTLNSTDGPYPKKTVYELFEEQAIKAPHKIALEFRDEVMTYEQLNEKSNQLAHYLRQKGIGRGSVLGIMMNHSMELVIGILGILKAGGAYLPIDPEYPPERISYMLEDSKSAVLLTDFKAGRDIEFKGSIIDIKDINLNLYGKENPPKVNKLNDLAYIIYTSGTTGKPKGVMIEHRGLTNYIWWAKKMYLKDENEAMPLYSSISFDLTATSVFTPLISGNRIIIYNTDENEFVLYKILKENKATVVKLTPAHLTLLKDMDNRSSNIKRFIVGGDDLKISLTQEICESFGKNIEIYNEYGPTEATVGCMIHKYDMEKDRGISVPIGRPAGNVQIYILDGDLNVVPANATGEIYISGDGISRGYLNRPELTEEKFIENPFIKGRKMYKTGDLAKYLKDGSIEYKGRLDNQVKIRGYRIELGEIEKHLSENEAVKDAAVVFKEDSSGNKSLNAYIVKEKEITELELKNYLLKFLPRYMIPANFVFMDRFPLNLNGKVDAASLPNPVRVKKEFVKYKTEKERKLVEAVEEILGIENVSMNDNFYQLGGDSIKAIQISSRLKNEGLDIKVKDILSCDSVEEIGFHIRENQNIGMIDQGQSQGAIERTPITEWFFSRNFSDENRYNQYVLLKYNKISDIDKIRIAVGRLTEHHDTLRINYDIKNHRLYYNNDNSKSSSCVKYVDLSGYCGSEDNMSVKELIDKAEINFDIGKGPLFNVTIFDLSGGRQALLFTAHHLTVDGVSWRIILEDFLTAMKQLDNNEEVKLPAKTHSFKDWAKVLKEYSKKDFGEERRYWQEISDKSFVYPTDFDKGKDTVGTSGILIRDIDEDILNKLSKKTGEIYNTEFSETLIILLVLTISSMTNSDEVVIELEGHGRKDINDYIDVKRTVGWFTVMYPVYFRIEDGDLNLRIKSLKEQLRNVPDNGFNYGILRFLNNELEEREEKYIRFNYLGDFDNIIGDIPDIEFGLDSDEENSLTSLMDIDAFIIKGRLKLKITYSKNKFSESTIRRFADKYTETIKSLLNQCIKNDSKEFTPSDFDAADISQEDLDSLFK